MKHLFITNPIAFRTSAKRTALAGMIDSVFRGDKLAYHLHESRFPRDAVLAIRRYERRRNAGETLRVYSCGGDGILFDCLNGIIGLPDAELAVLPFGRENEFATYFTKGKTNILLDLPLQMKSPSTTLDVLRCGNSYALGYCSIGTETTAVLQAKKIESLFSSSPKVHKLSYYLGSLAAVTNQSTLAQAYEVEIDGERIDDLYGTMNIANMPYLGGGMEVLPDASPDDGLFDCLMFRSASPFKTMTNVPSHISGHWKKHKDRYTFRQGKKLVVRSWKPMQISLDGERVFENEAHIEIVPGAVRVVNPVGVKA